MPLRALIAIAVTLPQLALAIDISFERDVLSVLTTKGCNSSGCHGSPAGQSGFKLSLYGADAAADYAMITSAHNGRRVDRAHPANSLLLRKPSFAVAHGGGHLLTPESDEYRTLLGWLRAGGAAEHGGAGDCEYRVGAAGGDCAEWGEDPVHGDGEAVRREYGRFDAAGDLRGER
jgi:hypothetical protein